jgi:tetratricopeptide (TPR) repeat protein
MVGRLAQDPEAQLKTCAVPQAALPRRCAQIGLVGCCGFLFVHLVADPLRADLNSSAASLAKTPGEALRCHREAVRICPRATLYWNRFAGFAESRGRWEHDGVQRERDYRTAQDAFANAVQREPGNGDHRAGLGRAQAELAKLGKADPQSAFAAFDAALQCDPSVAFFYVDASQAALQLGAADRAAAYIRAGLERYPSYGAMRKQAAMLLLLHNRPLEALSEFDRALAADWKGETDERRTAAEIQAEVVRRIGGIR